MAIVSRRAIDVARRRRLRVAIASLDFDHRVVVELHYLDELSLQEITAVLDVPVGTVKSRLFHARKRLRRALERAAEIDPR